MAYGTGPLNVAARGPDGFVQRHEAELVARRLASAIEGVMVEQAREIMWGLWEVNPRDTTHSSNNWRISIGEPNEEIDGSKKHPSNTEQRSSVKWLEGYKLRDGDIYIGNPVDYVGEVDKEGFPGLNAGWSPQASAGWIERVIERALAYTAKRLGTL
jgi:hypothetical protein